MRFVYDGFKLIETLNALSSNAVTKKYVWSEEMLLSVNDMNVSARYYYTQDANKNVSELLDASGNIVAHYEYSPFGKIVAQSGSYAATNPSRFSSEYFDEETGLVYYNFRYYSAELGRWLSKDPIEEEGGWNLYGMVNNNPLNWVDYLGLECPCGTGGDDSGTPYLDVAITTLEIILGIILAPLSTGCSPNDINKAKDAKNSLDTLSDKDASAKEKSDAAHDMAKEAARNKAEERYVDVSKELVGGAIGNAAKKVNKRERELNKWLNTYD